MSIENNDSVIDKVEPVVTDDAKKDEYVARKAYEDVSKDMHKYKSQVRDAQAAMNEAEAKLKAIEDQKLKDNQQWEELYNQQCAKSENAEKMRSQDKQLYLRSVKLNALKSELGGKVKEDYLSFANLDDIDINEDGTLSSDSVRTVANSFRQAHPQLIPSEGNPDITNSATKTSFSNDVDPEVAKMSFEEKAKLLNELKKQN